MFSVVEKDSRLLLFYIKGRIKLRPLQEVGGFMPSDDKIQEKQACFFKKKIKSFCKS